MNDDRAVEALKRFGLSTYEARVLLGLTKLGVGTASDVSEIVDVPRSQVYGAAEGLEEHGLIEIQHSSPTRYRPVATAEAKAKLFRRLETRGEAAFGYLEDVRGTSAAPEGNEESIWTIHGSENVADRVSTLIETATDKVIYGVEDPALIESRVERSLRRRGEECEITLVTANPEVEAAFDRIDPAEVVGLTKSISPLEIRGRTLIIDRETLLLSVLPTDSFPHLESETAFWSESTGFAMMLGSILEEWYASLAR